MATDETRRDAPPLSVKLPPRCLQARTKCSPLFIVVYGGKIRFTPAALSGSALTTETILATPLPNSSVYTTFLSRNESHTQQPQCQLISCLEHNGFAFSGKALLPRPIPPDWVIYK
jgi:hypothetical protein